MVLPRRRAATAVCPPPYLLPKVGTSVHFSRLVDYIGMSKELAQVTSSIVNAASFVATCSGFCDIEWSRE